MAKNYKNSRSFQSERIFLWIRSWNTHHSALWLYMQRRRLCYQAGSGSNYVTVCIVFTTVSIWPLSLATNKPKILHLVNVYDSFERKIFISSWWFCNDQCTQKRIYLTIEFLRSTTLASINNSFYHSLWSLSIPTFKANFGQYIFLG